MKRTRPPAFLLLLPMLAACQSDPASAPPRRDPHSHARPDAVAVTHVDLDLRLEFNSKCVAGRATLQLQRFDPAAPLHLDSAGLQIERVTAPDGTARVFHVGPVEPVLGAPLVIELAPADTTVCIDYRTPPGAAALQWLAPEQTRGGTAPFLFTQGQAILTRSWVPLQDSPAVRLTYGARIQAPEGMTVLMAADARGRDPDGAWRFEIAEPIPPYLLALACGHLTSRDLSPRCRVHAEPPLIELAARELADLEAMMRAGEQLFGAYPWGRYDVLILPPAFPFGGMENPKLTFATPTILAGDRSLVGLIAHELAHSWSGNLVTNATWRDFWLNEGFTVYSENRIMELVYGPDRAAMEALLGMQGLRRELRELPERDQVLDLDLSGRNPDDGMTAVAYDKGAAFLRMLEQAFGRERFDPFLADWFHAHRFQSVTTAQFLAYLERELLHGDAERRRELCIDEWVHRPGLPANAVEPHSDAFTAVDAARAQFLAGTAARALAARGWTTHEWLHFLNGLPRDCTTAQLGELDAAFGFTTTGNSEILAAWLVVAIHAGMPSVRARTEEFLLEVGRRKFLEPIYKALAATPQGRATARAIYARARPRYHAITQRTLDALLGYSASGAGG